MFEQERVLSRLQQRVLSDGAIKVCFLGGSYGRRQNDAFSDLDVILVYADKAARDAAYATRHEFARSVMPYVSVRSFDATHVRTFLHIALYANGAKVDFRYEMMTDLVPSAYDREIRIIKDTIDGWAEGFQAGAPQIAPPEQVLSAEAFAGLDNRFWVMFWDVYRQIRRGEPTKPFPVYVQLLYLTLPSLLSMLPPDHPAHQNLLAADFRRETAPTLTHLRSLMAAYREARTAVIERHNIPYSRDTAFEDGLLRLLSKR